MKLSRLKGASFDSLLLSIVKVFTIGVGIVSTMILSKFLSLSQIGTYSQGNLLVNSVTSVTILGFADAANFFYNRSRDKAERGKYINTIFGIELLVGIVTAIVMLACTAPITAYFENPELAGIIVYIVLRPMISNMTTTLQVLQVAIGRAKSIAVRNAIMSVFKLTVVSITAFVTQNIITIFASYLVMDILMLLWFAFNYFKEEQLINPLKISRNLIRPILAFSVPMGVYVMTNSLARDLDKYVIGWFESTERLAIYSNCATLLPFDIVSSAFLTIMIPMMTRFIANKQYEQGRQLFQCYLRIGYLSTFVFTVAAIICSREMILVLYSAEYLPGQNVFILYTIVDMLKFANLSLVLSAKGRTKTLMCISLASLGLNLVLNILFYWAFGFTGPAIATVLITLLSSVVLCSISAGILHTKIVKLLNFKEIGIFILELAVFGAGAYALQTVLSRAGWSPYLILVLVGGAFCGILFLINFRKIKSLFREVNQIGKKNDEMRMEENNG